MVTAFSVRLARYSLNARQFTWNCTGPPCGCIPGNVRGVTGFRAKILLDPEAQPRFCKACPVPYALRDKVEQELTRLTRERILEPVQFDDWAAQIADWAAQIVPVLKSDKSTVRICGDFKQTIDRVAKLDRYPIPKVEDLFSSLAGGKSFT